MAHDQKKPLSAMQISMLAAAVEGTHAAKPRDRAAAVKMLVDALTRKLGLSASGHDRTDEANAILEQIGWDAARTELRFLLGIEERVAVGKPAEMVEDGPGAPSEPAPVPTPSQAAESRPAAPAGRKRGRNAKHKGQRLFATTPDGNNPRRKTSAGFKSLQLIIDRPGITTEEFVAAGGRLADLRWDLKHGNVRAEA